MKKGTKIFNFSYMIDGCIPASRLAATIEIATARMKRMWGKTSKIEHTTTEFSHHVGDFHTGKDSVKPKVVMTKVATPTVEKTTEEKFVDKIGSTFSGK